MWQIFLFLLISLILFLLCLSQDREMDKELKFLIRYRYIQDDFRRIRANIN